MTVLRTCKKCTKYRLYNIIKDRYQFCNYMENSSYRDHLHRSFIFFSGFLHFITGRFDKTVMKLDDIII